MKRDARLARGSEAAVKELRSVVDMVRWCASRFNEHGLHFGHGTADAVGEALALVQHVLNLHGAVEPEVFTARLTRAEREQVVAMARERIQTRKPLPYLTGEAWFAGLRFNVDERVLVPRSPLAEWIERGFEPFLDPDRVRRVLDVGTGSGCIAIACAMAFPAARVDAVDLSAEALAVAADNVSRHEVGDRVTLLRGDLMEGCEGPYDLIISNPPYVPEASYLALPAEYAHEPAAGLRAGADGLAQVTRLIAQAPARLARDGILVVEVGEAAGALGRRMPDLALTWLEFERGGDGAFLVGREQLGEIRDGG
jgi:ribosomal protein L3 glutamine methyltransferase